MKQNKALGVSLVVALSGSLLVGCSSDSATTATSTPPANPLVGKWLLTRDTAVNPVIVLELEDGGVWTYKWGPSYDSLEQVGIGMYTVNEDDTITWTGGACVEGEPGIYTYTLENGEFTQTATDEPCDPRRDAYDGVTYTRQTASPSPSSR
jgi:hypothetical protein